MFSRGIVGGLWKVSVFAAKIPLGTAGFAFGVAKGVLTKSTELADSAVQTLRREALGGDPGPKRDEGAKVTRPAEHPHHSTSDATGGPAEEAADEGVPAKKAAAKKAQPARPPAEPQVVLREPGPPAEPPIDVVGQALAAEADDQPVARAGEPKASTRDESHGDAELQRAELDEIAEEVAEATPTGALDLETPVGTTGADVGFNPDTAEADLQQRGTAPLMDPATTSEVASEQETLSKASRTNEET